jgi:hypothetical protein
MPLVSDAKHAREHARMRKVCAAPCARRKPRIIRSRGRLSARLQRQRDAVGGRSRTIGHAQRQLVHSFGDVDDRAPERPDSGRWEAEARDVLELQRAAPQPR